jgi:CubicO group peptidase (beta-lactamase class C family)
MDEMMTSCDRNPYNYHRRNPMSVSRREFIRGGVIAGACLAIDPGRFFAVEEDIDRFVEGMIKEQHIAGLAACTVRGDRIEWSGGYGWADIEKKVPMDPEKTVQNIASVSKTVTATAVMQLWEKGKFKLDDPVDGHLSFWIRNPRFPGTRITFRQLLSHRSSIKDGPSYDASYTCGDPTLSLKEWLREYFTPKGRFYDGEENFHVWKPGETGEIPAKPRAYTNVGYGLLGHLVEAISGKDLPEYCREHIFKPLGMNHTGWFLSEMDVGRHAVPYTFIAAGETGEVMTAGGRTEKRVEEDAMVANCLYSFPNYPDGLVRTSVHQLARFLLAYLQGGAYRGARILKPETVATMLSRDHFGRGLCWSRYDYKEQVVWAHGGGDPGVSTVMMFRPADQTGVIVFANTMARLAPLVRKLF